MDTPSSLDKIVFPELSYQILGSAFSVFNSLGGGLPEKYYQRALAEEFSKRGLTYRREVCLSFEYGGVKIANYFADFVVAEKVVLELKIVPKLGYVQLKQILGYLKQSGMKLGILIYFTKDGVKYRRVLNSEV